MNKRKDPTLKKENLRLLKWSFFTLLIGILSIVQAKKYLKLGNRIYDAIVILPSNKSKRSCLAEFDFSSYGQSILYIQSIPFINFFNDNKSEQLLLAYCFLKAFFKCLAKFQIKSFSLSKQTWKEFSRIHYANFYISEFFSSSCIAGIRENHHGKIIEIQHGRIFSSHFDYLELATRERFLQPDLISS